MSGASDNAVRVWRVDDEGPMSWVNEEHDKPVSCLAALTDEDCYASGSADGTVRVWSVHTSTSTHCLNVRVGRKSGGVEGGGPSRWVWHQKQIGAGKRSACCTRIRVLVSRAVEYMCSGKLVLVHQSSIFTCTHAHTHTHTLNNLLLF